MKLLLSCVNTTVSLIGYDWEEGHVFWTLPSHRLKACGICYHNSDLMVASDNLLSRLSASNILQSTLTGPHDVGAHSVHAIDKETVGIVDTGNSLLRLIDSHGNSLGFFDPIGYWEKVPADAIHLNDFVVTPLGILASCFEYRPWRRLQMEISKGDWFTGGYGLILNLSDKPSKSSGKIVGCGFNHPHSLTYHHPHLCLCSASTGVFHLCGLNDNGTVQEVTNYPVTSTHFLRGALNVEGGWFLGGSCLRHGEKVAEDMEIYFLHEASGDIESKTIKGFGEIYDILPWEEEIMAPIVKRHFP